MSNVKPLLRFLRTCLTFLSLLLFVAFIVLWFRSRTHLDEFYAYRPLSYRNFWSVEGRHSRTGRELAEAIGEALRPRLGPTQILGRNLPFLRQTRMPIAAATSRTTG